MNRDDDPLIWYSGEPGRVEYAQREINKARKDVGLGPLVTFNRSCLRCEKEFSATQKDVRMCESCRKFSALEYF